NIESVGIIILTGFKDRIGDFMKYGYWLSVIFLAFVVTSVLAFSGQRHWVGSGSGNGKFWDRTANWSLTQGGAGGAVAPTASDDVFVDGGGSLEINTAAVCLSYNQSASTGTKGFTNNSTLTVGSGGMVLSGGALSLNANGNAIAVSGNMTISGGTLDL